MHERTAVAQNTNQIPKHLQAQTGVSPLHVSLGKHVICFCPFNSWHSSQSNSTVFPQAVSFVSFVPFPGATRSGQNFTTKAVRIS